jgi:hypothetical protein
VVADSAELIDANTIANANDVAATLREKTAAPEVSRGYWSTIRFCWDTRCEVEVFGDRIELYQFHDKRTDIQCFDHAPGVAFTTDATRQLLAAINAAG